MPFAAEVVLFTGSMAAAWRYDLNLWIGHSLEGAAYLPR
jgi:hypothetical protein